MTTSPLFFLDALPADDHVLLTGDEGRHAARVRRMRVGEPVRAIPIVEPEVVHEIGLVVPFRDPVIPMVAALVAEARKLADSKEFAA